MKAFISVILNRTLAQLLTVKMVSKKGRIVELEEMRSHVFSSLPVSSPSLLNFSIQYPSKVGVGNYSWGETLSEGSGVLIPTSVAWHPNGQKLWSLPNTLTTFQSQSSTAFICWHGKRDQNHSRSTGRHWVQKWYYRTSKFLRAFQQEPHKKTPSHCNDSVGGTLWCSLNTNNSMHLEVTGYFTKAGKVFQQIINSDPWESKRPPSLGLATCFCRSKQQGKLEGHKLQIPFSVVCTF